MAGSYKHVTDDEGRLVHPMDIGIGCENDGDSYETVEEMYGMIWYLAGGDSTKVERARKNFKMGIMLSPGRRTEPYPMED